MDDVHFDSLSRTLATGQSRRAITRLLGGFTLGGPLALLGLQSADAKCKKKCGPCKRCKKGKCKPKPAGTACAGGSCQRGACIPAASPPPPPPPPGPSTRADATCTATVTSLLLGDGNERMAQTFTALASGPLVSADILTNKAPGTAGDYVLHLGAVDASGIPTNAVLAAALVPNLNVPTGVSTVTFMFANPFSVVAGTQYALMLSRPGSTDFQWAASSRNPCPGLAFRSVDQTAPFVLVGTDLDLMFTTFVRS